MNRNKFAPLALASLLMLAGCDYNDKNFEGLEEATQPTNVIKKDYTLADADYATISADATNKALAGKENEKALAALKTNMYFTDLISAEKYIPAFLTAQYFTADDGSSVKVTYKQKVSLPKDVIELNGAGIYTLAADNYQKAWGDKSSLNFFTPAKPAATYLPAILAEEVAEPAKGDIVCASYNVSDKEPADVTIAFKEDFEGATANANIELSDWTNTTVAGTFQWQAKIFGGNLYAQQSAYKHTGALDSYLISKEIAVEKGMLLTLDAIYVNLVEKGGTVKVLVSSNLADATTAAGIAAATWDDLTAKFTIPTSTTNSGDPSNVGTADLSAYVNKKVRIAFRYQGDGSNGATTTIRIDNVAISTPGKNVYQLENRLYAFDGTKWAPYTNANVTMLSQVDFTQMGSKYDNFSSTMNPDNYLPTFLKMKFPYAQQDEVKVVAYKYYDSASKVTSIRADEYSFANGQFVKNDAIETMTSQFVYSKGKWNFDPSTVIELPAVKGDAMSVLYFKTIIEWVKGAHSEYVNSYGDSEYYYGASSYNCNFDFRASTWKSNVASAYGDMTNEALEKLMKERLPESFIHALEKLNADAVPVEGVEVIYTVNFAIYNGTATTKWTVKYLVTAPGKFEYIADSLKELK